MFMKTQMVVVLVMAAWLSAIAPAKESQSIMLSVETDRPILQADEKQTAYVRVGLTGCPDGKRKERVPVNVAIVIDKSGSMASDRKIENAREAALLAVDKLDSSDILSVIAYNHQVEVLIPATRLTDKRAVRDQIRRLNADGNTALYAGVQKGADEVRKFLERQRVNRIVLISDGLANVGPSSPDVLGKLGCQLAEDGISVTTVGLGLGYNEDLMSRLAFNSDGSHYFAQRASDLAEIFDKEFSRTLSVVAQKVQIEIICGEGMRPVRILGREGLIKDRTVAMEIQNIYGNHEKFAILEVELPAHAEGKIRELACVRINYLDMETDEAMKAGGAVDVRFSNSKDDVKKSTNKRVMADVVELLAVERNEMAMKLRDQGKVEQARQTLNENVLYLRTAASEYDCPALDKYAADNAKQGEQLDDANWSGNRKGMVESQTMRKSQR
jgi:Ca-activated chloride channel family protein